MNKLKIYKTLGILLLCASFNFAVGYYIGQKDNRGELKCTVISSYSDLIYERYKKLDTNNSTDSVRALLDSALVLCDCEK